jgi:hypothetical protein
MRLGCVNGRINLKLSTMSTLRRSSRSVRKRPVTYNDLEANSYPDCAPVTDFEKMVATLDSETYLSHRYAAVDDVIVDVFFRKKRQPAYYNRLQLKKIGSGLFPTDEEGLDIARLCYRMVSRGNPTLDECRTVGETIREHYPKLFQPDDVPLLRQ